ncbi:VanZ family protein [uncultured Piscinibacter sp.]|uniref:VanZ family protein n=1 Tax=uncultured Piscinibacter sp. TaxID=1131835 RepID=UPI0026333DF7|nr:VanZ family protein [uncultured Piscinibacter sp.]
MPTPAVAPGEDGRPHAGAVRALHLICLVLVTHGSLYPWEFGWPVGGFASAWRSLWTPGPLWSGLGDVVGNVALFVPIGALMLLDLRQSRVMPRWLVPIMLLLGTLFAILLQVLQIAVPARDPQLSDVAWNVLGLLIGAALSGALRRLRLATTSVDGRRAVQLWLIGVWLVTEWWPLIPTIDWQHVKDALKPLLLAPRWSVHSVAESALMVVVVARLLRGLPAAGWLLLGVVGFALGGKLFIAEQAISLGRACGMAAGLLLGAASLRLDATLSARWLVASTWVWLSLDELRPFELAGSVGVFQAIPFVALLQGSLSANTLGLLLLTFWVGVILVFTLEVGARPGVMATGLCIWLLTLEVAQMFLPGRVADITPMLVPALWVLALHAAGAVPPSASRAPRKRQHRRTDA